MKAWGSLWQMRIAVFKNVFFIESNMQTCHNMPQTILPGRR